MNTSQIGVAPDAAHASTAPSPGGAFAQFGEPAELLLLAAQTRRARDAGDTEAEARSCGALARLLARRGIEVREMLALAERAVARGDDGSLASELSAWWAGVGEPARAAQILQRVEGRASTEDRAGVLVRIGVLLSRAGLGAEAARAFQAAAQADVTDPLPLELLGSLGGWSAVTPEVASRAFQEAAERRLQMGDETAAFENSIRAFETCPADAGAAERLSVALLSRGRTGAAEEVIREQARSGSAARRAAVHERRFARHVSEGDLDGALGAALDAELDAGLDPTRLLEVLAAEEQAAGDAESVFVRAARQEPLLSEWLLAAIDVGVFTWGAAQAQAARTRVASTLLGGARARLAPEMALGGSEITRRISSLREQLLRIDAADAEPARLELARLHAARGTWSEAHDAVEPLLARPAVSMEAACLLAVLAVRARRPDTRARALAAAAWALSGRARAVVGSVASELLLETGRASDARAVAELAVAGDPSWQRAVAAQALVAQREPDAAAAAVLERSLSVVLARASACRVLAESSERRGALRLALTWTQRELSLRPGDPNVARQLLRRAAAAGDGERLADALSWLLSQPLPHAELADIVALSLSALARLLPERSAELARRVLDVVGPRFESVLSAVTDVARRVSSFELEAQAIERYLVTAPPEARANAQLTLAGLRVSLGDVTAAARALRRALAGGVPPEEVVARLAELPAPNSADAVVASLEVRAEAAVASEGAVSRGRQIAELYWALGAARWELAKDQKGAIAAWTQALVHDDDEGAARLARTLVSFVGAESATVELERIAVALDDRARASRLLGHAARLAVEAHMPGEGFRLAREALLKDATNMDVLGIAERSAGPRELELLVSLYGFLAEATLGRYGERAVHYRAARQLERRGRHEIALRHAIAAFEAVPGEGVAFVLMARLAERASASAQVVAAIERVAARAPTKELAALWLGRAAALADTTDAGRRQRLDVLLRALVVRPDAPTLGTVSEAIRQLLAACPEDREIVLLRFERALSALLPKVGGPDGALFALRAAQSAVSLFGVSVLGVRALRRAAECDGDIEQFAELASVLGVLVEARDEATSFVRWCAERASQRLTNVGRPLALLGAQLAERLEERDAEAHLLLRAAMADPSDVAAARRVRQLAEQLDDPELLGAVEALVPLDERARLTVAQAAGASVEEALDLLLDIELGKTSEETRALVLSALALRQEEIGRLDDAASSFRALAALRPTDTEALRGLERAAERRGDFEEVIRLLDKRAELATDLSEVRRIRLRRATLLEQRLGRPDAARADLEQLLEQGDELSVLRVLADLCRRTGDPGRAATLWLRASGAATTREEAEELIVRSAEAHLEAGDIAGARRALDGAAAWESSLAVAELRLRVEQKAGDPGRSSDAMAELAGLLPHDAGRAASLLVEAARLSLGKGDTMRALELAQRAADLAPRSSDAQLLARRLEYLTRGVGSAEEARVTVEQLRGLSELTHRQTELRAFLLAEALDVVEGGGAGRRELDAAAERVGSRALIAVGLAERSDGEPRRALSHLDSALGSDLHGLRSEGQVLIRAGRAARALGELDRAQAYFSAVSSDDARQSEAASELREVAAARLQLEREREERAARQRAEREAAERAEREAIERAEREAIERAERERVMAEARREQLALERREAEEREAAERAEREAMERAEREAIERAERERVMAEARREQLALERREAEEREAAERAEREAMERAEREAIERAERERVMAEARREQLALERREAEEREAAEQAERERAKELARQEQLVRQAVERAERQRVIDLARQEQSAREQSAREQSAREAMERAERESEERVPSSRRLVRPSRPPGVSDSSKMPASPRPSLASDLEIRLAAALEMGDVEAGRELLVLLERDTARGRDRVLVALRVAALVPTDAWVLEQLARAAEQERNEPLRLAVRHVLGAFGGGPRVVAPELARVREQPEEVRRIVTRGIESPGASAAALVWEHVPHAFKRDPGAYGITGLERLPLGASTLLGRLYTEAARVLGASRTPLFQRRGSGAITMAVALMMPPALLVSGDIDEITPELSFHFGAMLMATSPEFSILFGADPSKVRTLLEALLVSFAPPSGARPNPAATRLAALLWESIPPRGQRRLAQLCADPELLVFERVVGQTRLVLRRAGLVLSADLWTAVAATSEEEGFVPPDTLEALADLCARSPAILDLVRLALTPEYAEVRWSAR